MEVTSRFKELNLVDGVSEEQESVTKTISKKKKCKKATWLSEEGLQIAKEKKKEKQKAREKGKDISN